ncbi:hypothetical protein [uncultured Ruegeria sp.]|uniref:hypothetical protein n=1 Tax=uncultured Ruegeria sp. TaxID=259304 RepID=UPI0026266979|nr:hypothetical protein [uncultured Ruegeria sp.]
MGALSRKFPIYLVATTFLVASSQESFAAGVCNVKTARQSGASAQVLCECDAVTTGMIRYVQRRADFDKILARLGAECSPLAALLTDFPTAATGAANERSGDGPSNEGGDNGPTGGGIFGGNDDPTDTDTPGDDNPSTESEEPEGEEPEGEEPEGEEPEGEEPEGEEPEGEEPEGEEPEGEEPEGEEPEGEEPEGEEPEEEPEEERRQMAPDTNKKAKGMRDTLGGKKSSSRGFGKRERK